jgi:hypothetical protein
MTAEEQEFIFGVYDEECLDLPSGPQIDKLFQIIRDHPGRTKMELWNLLAVPKWMNYSAFSNILCALVKKNMVTADADGRYSWIGKS